MGETLLICLAGFFFIFTCTNFIEKEWRAFRRSSLVLIFILMVLAVWILGLPPLKHGLGMGLSVLAVGLLFWIALSPCPRTRIHIEFPPNRIDERDVIFSRFDLKEGSQEYQSYYARRPEFEERDARIRELPDILSPHHVEKQPWLFSLADAEFEFLEAQLQRVSGTAAAATPPDSAENNTRCVKQIAAYLGASHCGICELDPSYVYSHVGRGPAPYGQKIELRHAFAVAFAVEMDYAMIACAPNPPVIVETARQYVEAAKISIIIAGLARKMGAPARAHIAGSNYNAMLPPLAWKAGLGELGRMGILMTRDLGPRLRLGLVTTDLPLVPDQPVSFGVQDFCRRCRKCAANCPSQAIPEGDPALENGVWKWTIDREACYRYWRKVGTDCARCIFVCPYAKPNNTFHTLIQKFAGLSTAAQKVAIRADDWFYGRFPRPHKPPF